MKRFHSMKLLAAFAAMLAIAPATQAATINFSNIETILADPDDMLSLNNAKWAGYNVQVYEYNMPFIEVENPSDATYAIGTFTMTIGDTDFQFSNSFLGLSETNSSATPAPGEYAATGFSTPDIDFTSSVADDGDTLILDFGPDGLQPGEVVRFQVDIDRDPGVSGKSIIAPYTSVFFDEDGGDDTTGNSEIRLDFVDTDVFAELTLPNIASSDDVSMFLETVRPYDTMQQVDIHPATPFDIIPEPATAVLAGLAMVGVATRRRD